MGGEVDEDVVEDDGGGVVSGEGVDEHVADDLFLGEGGVRFPDDPSCLSFSHARPTAATRCWLFCAPRSMLALSSFIKRVT